MSRGSRVNRYFAPLALVFLAAAALPATAEAANFRVVGSFLDTADLSEAPGLGVGVDFPIGQGNWAVDLAFYYFEDFENRFEADSDNATVCANPGCPEKVELSSYPIDLGLRYRRSPDDGGLVAGFGISAFLVDPDNADGDDQEGAYAMIGYEAASGWLFEFLYRDADITIENIELVGIPGLIPDDFQLDMSGYQINIGYSF